MKDNCIYIFIKDDNTSILEYSDLNIVTKAYIGKNGVTNNKIEGDQKTPLGEFAIGLILGTHSKEEIKNSKYIQITKDMYWIDDSNSKYYNKLVDINNVKKDWNSAEHLIDYPIQYEYLIEIKANPKNMPKKGSAIFLHCSKNNYTAGCVSIDKNIMKKIIENINSKTKINIKKINNKLGDE